MVPRDCDQESRDNSDLTEHLYSFRSVRRGLLSPSEAMAGSKEAGPRASVITNGESEDKSGEGEAAENLWSALLGEVQTSRSSQLPSSKSLLVLGDKESGKTTLIAKLQGNEDPKKGSGLEYGYIDVRDEYRDDHTRLSHWILDGDTSHANLLNFALTEKNYEGLIRIGRKYIFIVLAYLAVSPQS